MDRIQRKRTKGFKLPPNTLVITRGTPFGNQWKVEQASCGCYYVSDGIESHLFVNKSTSVLHAVKFFKKELTPELKQKFIDTCVKKNIQHLACFCSVDSPCHGDVWLDVWNEYQKESGNQ